MAGQQVQKCFFLKNNEPVCNTTFMLYLRRTLVRQQIQQ